MIFISTILLLSQAWAAGSNAKAGFSLPAATYAAAAAPTVAGRVITESNAPLPGVVVNVQGTPQVTSTNADGDFLLPLAENMVLVFKCQGYHDQTLSVSASAPLTVKMYSLNVTAPAGGASKSEVLSHSEVPPTFPGGEKALRAFVGQNAHFPESALEKELSGTVFVSFVVDEQGRITDAKVVRSAGNGFDEEALRVVRLMPWWNPGLVAGKPVRVSRVLPIPFIIRARQ